MPTIVVDRTHRSEELRAQREAMLAADQEVRENWHDPAYHYELARLITTTLYERFTHENLIELFTDVEYVGLGDDVVVKEVRGLEAVWVSLGGQIDQSTLDRRTFTIPKDYVGFHVSEFEEKMQNSWSVSSQEMIDLGQERMDASIQSRLFRIFQRGIPDSHSSHIAAEVTKPALDTAISQVRDVSRSNVVTLVGRGLMTDKVMNVVENSNLFTPETNEQILRTGRLGVYRGARIVSLTNWLDNDDVPYFPGDELWVLGADASKAAFFGGLVSKEGVEAPVGWYWHWAARRGFGAVLYRKDRVRRFVDPTMTP